jgi:valyl-tRNA synthetase
MSWRQRRTFKPPPEDDDMRRVLFTRIAVWIVAGAVVGGAVAGCGESKEKKAMKAVCSARSEIQKSVENLRSLTLTSASGSGVKNDISTIQTNVQKIVENEKALSGNRKQQVSTATKKFGQQLQTIASGLTSNLSLSNAASQVKSAGDSLLAAYRSALAPIDC